MKMDAAGVLQHRAKTPGAWDFQWADAAASGQLAHLTGQLRWRGIDLSFALDGLLGVDGRLSATSLATMPPDLQQLVLQHFAAECLQALEDGPLDEMTLLSLQWNENPLPMVGEYEFTLKRAELPGFSRGRLTVFSKAGQRQLLNALASLGWPLPNKLSAVRGRLRIGSACLTTDECANLEVGDLVWLDDAEVAPAGLRAEFLPCDESDAACLVWIKRSAMSRSAATTAVASVPSNEIGDARVLLTATSLDMNVQRAWLQGTSGPQPLAKTAMALTWKLFEGKQAWCEGQLLVVRRRLGLRVTHVF